MEVELFLIVLKLGLAFKFNQLIIVPMSLSFLCSLAMYLLLLPHSFQRSIGIKDFVATLIVNIVIIYFPRKLVC